MAHDSLGRLQKVELRAAWASESGDFTPWLAKEVNMTLLGEAIGLELELESQEKNVGPFRADILCKDTATDNWVLIENQLERTDHGHLGQLITYAAGLNAVTIVWIAERFTDEHRAALDWINEHTDEKINLFGLEVELWKIGDSPMAPKFNVVSQPNDWARTVQQAATNTGERSEHQLYQQQYWTAFRSYMEEQESYIRCTKALPQHWMNIAIGRSGMHLSCSNKAEEIRVTLVIVNENSKEEFSKLLERQVELEQLLGPLEWHNPEGKIMCRIYARTSEDIYKKDRWPDQFEWMKQNLERFHEVFAPIVREMKYGQV